MAEIVIERNITSRIILILCWALVTDGCGKDDYGVSAYHDNQIIFSNAYNEYRLSIDKSSGIYYERTVKMPFPYNDELLGAYSERLKSWTDTNIRAERLEVFINPKDKILAIRSCRGGCILFDGEFSMSSSYAAALLLKAKNTSTGDALKGAKI